MKRLMNESTAFAKTMEIIQINESIPLQMIQFFFHHHVSAKCW